MNQGSSYFRLSSIAKSWMAVFLVMCLLGPYIQVQAQNQGITNKVEPVIAVLVEQTLIQSSLKTKIDRYAQDIKTALPAHVVLIPVPRDASPLDIYEGLKHFYFSGFESDEKSQLQGVVLIGEVPLPVVEKNGYRYPTIFPYTDFEEEVYQWDPQTHRFSFIQDRSMESEIWHGVIRSSESDLRGQIAELTKYFEENHKVHRGEKRYDPRVFSVNPQDQSKALGEAFRGQYQTWLDNAEDLLYHRWSAPLLTSLFEDEELESFLEGDPEGRNPLEYIPDILSRSLIEGKAKSYQQIHAHWLEKLYEDTAQAGRWDVADIDTTMSLISRQDSESLQQLKNFNDALEQATIQALQRSQVAADISVIAHSDYAFEVGEVRRSYRKPLYWNGVKRSQMTAEDCSLYRGTPATLKNPYGQQVLASRVWGGQEAGQGCSTPDSDLLVRYIDPYEGCCALNTTIDPRTQIKTYTHCDGGSVWGLQRYGAFDFRGDEALEREFLQTHEADLVFEVTSGIEAEAEEIDSVPPQEAQKPLYAFEHHGAQKSLFDLLSAHKGEGPMGALGCAGLLVNPNEVGDKELLHTFNSLVVHNEPRPETLALQTLTQTASHLPIDDPRGVSFYDQNGQFQRLNFYNIFDLRGFEGSFETFEKRIRSRFEAFAQTFESLGAPLSLEVLEQAFEKVSLEDLYASVNWLDQELEDKNTAIFTQALHQNDFAVQGRGDFEGYELVEIVAQEGEDGRLNMDFSKAIPIFDEALLTYKSSLADFTYKSQTQARSLGDSQLSVEASKLEVPKPHECERESFSWLSKMRCSIEDFFKEDQDEPSQETQNNEAEEAAFTAGKARVFNPQDNVALRLEPTQIVTARTSDEPFKILVDLADLNQGTLQSDDYQTLLSLDFDQAQASDFFEIKPGPQIPATAGRAVFYLTPKPGFSTLVQGSFDLNLRAFRDGNLVEQKMIPVNLSDYRLVFDHPQPAFEADGDKRITLEVKVLGEDGNLSRDFEGQLIVFRLQEALGKRVPLGEGVIENGRAILRYAPGNKAGLMTITAEHEAARIKGATQAFEITPSVPSDLSFETSHTHIVPHRGIDFRVYLVDQFGNRIKDVSHEVHWSFTNAQVHDGATKDIDPRQEGIQDLVQGASQMHFVAENLRRPIKIRAHSTLLGSEKGIAVQLDPLKNPRITAQASGATFTAGEEALIRIEVLAHHDDAVLGGKIPLHVAQNPETFVSKPSAVVLEDGRAQFTLLPHHKAGDFTLELMADGFPATSLPFVIQSGAPKKLEIEADFSSIDMRKKVPFSVDVSVFDAYKNLVKAGSQKLKIRPTPATAHLVKESSQQALSQEGIARFTFTPTGHRGSLHLMAEADGLLGDTFEIPFGVPYEAQDWETLSPSSLVSFLLGFDGGDLSDRRNRASAFLRDGLTQAVVSLAQDPDPDFVYGYVDPDGTLSESLTADFLSKEWLAFTFKYQGDSLAEAQLRYKKPVEVYFDQTPQEEDAIFFKPQEGARLRLVGQSLLLNDVAILQFGDFGGIKLIDTALSLRPAQKNILTWDLFRSGILLGQITYASGDLTFQSLDDFDTTGTTSLQAKALKSSVDFEKTFTQHHTNQAFGWRIINPFRSPSPSQTLGSSHFSIESIGEGAQNIWEGPFKPATHLASGHTIGESTRLGGSDALIVQGDPTLRLSTKASFEIDKSLGTMVWKSDLRSIDQILAFDINQDGSTDLLPLVGQELHLLLGDKSVAGRFRDTGLLALFDQPIRRIQSLDLPSGKAFGASDLSSSIFGDDPDKKAQALLVLEAAGDLSWLLEKDDGSFYSSKAGMSSFEGMTFNEVKVADFDGDDYPDLALLNEHNELLVSHGSRDGFKSPELVYEASPDFQSVQETYQKGDKITTPGGYLSGLEIQHQEGAQPPGEDKARVPQEITEDNAEEILAYLASGQAYEPDQEAYQAALAHPDVASLGLSITSNRAPSSQAQQGGKTSKSSQKVKVGDEIEHQLEITFTRDFKSPSLLLPQHPDMAFIRDSLRCEGCVEAPEAMAMEVLDQVQLNLGARSSTEPLRITWSTRVKKLLPLALSVGDFDANPDGLDDILIPDTEEGSALHFSSKTKEVGEESWLAEVVEAQNKPLNKDQKNIVRGVPGSDDADEDPSWDGKQQPPLPPLNEPLDDDVSPALGRDESPSPFWLALTTGTDSRQGVYAETAELDLEEEAPGVPDLTLEDLLSLPRVLAEHNARQTDRGGNQEGLADMSLTGCQDPYCRKDKSCDDACHGSFCAGGADPDLDYEALFPEADHDSEEFKLLVERDKTLKILKSLHKASDNCAAAGSSGLGTSCRDGFCTAPGFPQEAMGPAIPSGLLPTAGTVNNTLQQDPKPARFYPPLGIPPNVRMGIGNPYASWAYSILRHYNAKTNGGGEGTVVCFGNQEKHMRSHSVAESYGVDGQGGTPFGDRSGGLMVVGAVSGNGHTGRDSFYSRQNDSDYGKGVQWRSNCYYSPQSEGLLATATSRLTSLALEKTTSWLDHIKASSVGSPIPTLGPIKIVSIDTDKEDDPSTTFSPAEVSIRNQSIQGVDAFSNAYSNMAYHLSGQLQRPATAILHRDFASVGLVDNDEVRFSDRGEGWVERLQELAESHWSLNFVAKNRFKSYKQSNSIEDLPDNEVIQEALKFRADQAQALSELGREVKLLVEKYNNELAAQKAELEKLRVTLDLEAQLVDGWGQLTQIFDDFTDIYTKQATDRGTLVPWLVEMLPGINTDMAFLGRQMGVLLGMAKYDLLTLPESIDDTAFGKQQFPVFNLPQFPDVIKHEENKHKIQQSDHYVSQVEGFLQNDQKTKVSRAPIRPSTFSLMTSLFGDDDTKKTDLEPYLGDFEGADLSGLAQQLIEEVDTPLLHSEYGAIPNLMPAIAQMIALPQKAMGTLGAMRLNTGPVPEWWLKGHIDQLTNRGGLVERDLTNPTLPDPRTDQPKVQDWVERTIEPPIEKAINSPERYQSLGDILKDFQHQVAHLVAVSEGQKQLQYWVQGLGVLPEIYDTPGRRQQAQHLEKHYQKLETFTDDFKADNHQLEILAQSLAPLDFWSHDLVQQALLEQPADRYLATEENAASLSSILEALGLVFQTSLESSAEIEHYQNLFSSALTSEKEASTPESGGVYWKDDKGVRDSLFDYRTAAQSQSVMADLDSDGTQELVYSLGSELYWRSVSPLETSVDFKIAHWDYEDFVSLFGLGYDPTIKTHHDAFFLAFDPQERDRYHELILSRRPDALREIDHLDFDKKAQSMRRYGFLPERSLKLYEIKPVQAHVLKVQGDIYYSTPEIMALPNIDLEACDDPSVIKPFIPRRTQIISLKDDTTLRLRIPPRDGQVSKLREIRMHKNEETVVDYAEICVLRGKAQYIDTGEYTTRKIQEGDNLFGVTEFDLGAGQQIKLKLEDGTVLTIGPHQKYYLRTLDHHQKTARFQAQIPPGSWYGWLRAYEAGQPGFLQSKLNFYKPSNP